MKIKLVVALIAGVLPFVAGCEKAAEPAPTDPTPPPAVKAVEPQSGPAPVAVDPDASVRSVYPSAEEEKVFGLGYPTFLSYGPDSLRVTPFPPGSNDRPVEVALVQSANGYSLKVEGDGCKFPIAYELRDAAGATVSSGLNTPPATDTIPAWASGEARLLIKMGEGAENNFGCNLVISKL